MHELSHADLALSLRAHAEEASPRAAAILREYADRVAALDPEPDAYAAALAEFDARDLTETGRRRLWDALTEEDALGTPEEERAQIALAQAGDPDARLRILAAYMPLIKRVQRAHAGDAGWREEVRQAAVVGLFAALAAFRLDGPHRRLSALAGPYIADEVAALHSGRFALTVPKADRIAYDKARAAAVAQDGGEPDPERAAELAPEFGLSTPDFWTVHLAATWEPVTRPGDDSTEERQARSLWDPADPAGVLTAVRVETVMRAADLTNQQTAALNGLYGLNGSPAYGTRAAVADALGITERRVYQLLAGYTVRGTAHEGALPKLRRAAQILGLAPADPEPRERTEFLRWPSDVDTEGGVTLSRLTPAQRRRVVGWWAHAAAVLASHAHDAIRAEARKADRLAEGRYRPADPASAIASHAEHCADCRKAPAGGTKSTSDLAAIRERARYFRDLAEAARPPYRREGTGTGVRTRDPEPYEALLLRMYRDH